MTVATLSHEARIIARLAELRCPASAFAKINGLVARRRLEEGLNGMPGTHFGEDVVKGLFTVLDEMEDLARLVEVPIDWSQTEGVKSALAIRRVAIANHELGFGPMDGIPAWLQIDFK